MLDNFKAKNFDVFDPKVKREKQFDSTSMEKERTQFND